MSDAATVWVAAVAKLLEKGLRRVPPAQLRARRKYLQVVAVAMAEDYYPKRTPAQAIAAEEKLFNAYTPTP